MGFVRMEFFEKLRKRSKLVQSNFFQKVEKFYEIKIDQIKSRSPIQKLFQFLFSVFSNKSVLSLKKQI